MKAILLGTSGAWPTPRPGCPCDQCAEARRDPRLRRTRSSLWIVAGGEIVLVDPGPDVFHQVVREALPPRIDRVLVTHTHVDHCLGLDDAVHLRQPRRAPLRVHAAPWHRERLAAIFPHLVEASDPKVVWDAWEAGTRLAVGEVLLEGFETGHRDAFPTTALLLHVPEGEGVRRIAYATDMGMALPDQSRALLRGIDLLVGDGSFLGGAGHGHPGTDAVIALARDLGITRVAFTHVGHVLVDDAELRRRLGGGVGVARDGDDLLAV